jgi:histidyl-tRNA synthetase
VRALLDAAQVDYEVDPTLVRGLDYYTRTVFEFTSDALGAQSGVAGGGRYDGLVELLGGPPTPGCGFAAGIERMLLASAGVPVGPPPVDLYVAFDAPAQRADAFKVVDEARRARLNAQIELAGRSRKGQLKHADRIGARYVALVGDDTTVLKDMQAGEQRELPTGDVVARILRTRGMR